MWFLKIIWFRFWFKIAVFSAIAGPISREFALEGAVSDRVVSIPAVSLHLRSFRPFMYSCCFFNLPSWVLLCLLGLSPFSQAEFAIRENVLIIFARPFLFLAGRGSKSSPRSVCSLISLALSSRLAIDGFDYFVSHCSRFWFVGKSDMLPSLFSLYISYSLWQLVNELNGLSLMSSGIDPIDSFDGIACKLSASCIGGLCWEAYAFW